MSGLGVPVGRTLPVVVMSVSGPPVWWSFPSRVASVIRAPRGRGTPASSQVMIVFLLGKALSLLMERRGLHILLTNRHIMVASFATKVTLVIVGRTLIIRRVEIGRALHMIMSCEWSEISMAEGPRDEFHVPGIPQRPHGLLFFLWLRRLGPDFLLFALVFFLLWRSVATPASLSPKNIRFDPVRKDRSLSAFGSSSSSELMSTTGGCQLSRSMTSSFSGLLSPYVDSLRRSGWMCPKPSAGGAMGVSFTGRACWGDSFARGDGWSCSPARAGEWGSSVGRPWNLLISVSTIASHSALCGSTWRCSSNHSSKVPTTMLLVKSALALLTNKHHRAIKRLNHPSSKLSLSRSWSLSHLMKA